VNLAANWLSSSVSFSFVKEFASMKFLSLSVGFTAAATCALAMVFACALLIVLPILVSSLSFLSVKRLGSFTFLEEVTSNRGVGGGKKAGVELTPRSGSSTSAANQLRRPPSADFLAKITQAEKRDDVRNSPRAAAGRDEAVTAAPTADSPARPRPSAKPLGEPSPRGKLGSMIAQRQAAMAASMNATMDPSLTETLETHI
jgi:hypothetical protein